MRMIFILFALFYVDAGCLQVSVFQIANPYIFPGWRNNQLFYTLKSSLIPQLFFASVINESIAFFNPIDSRLGILHIHQINSLSALLSIVQDGLDFFGGNFNFLCI